MDKKQFKYAEWLTGLPDCPPLDYREVEMTAWRFVHREAAHPNNFRPVYVINPRRFPKHIPCKALGLSFYNDEENAKRAWNEQIESHPNFSVVAGTNLARLDVSPEDGIASLPEEMNFGHFTFHEYFCAEFAEKIISTEPIIV